VSTSSYVTVDATAGYRWHRYGVSVNGYNLTNVRKPVTNSEFGDSSFYVLPARAVLFNLSCDFKE
jgi:outer membrane receptor protein involved in Fe transport